MKYVFSISAVYDSFIHFSNIVQRPVDNDKDQLKKNQIIIFIIFHKMQGLDNFKTGTKETGGNRNVVSSENAKNLLDCKEIKRNSDTRS